MPKQAFAMPAVKETSWDPGEFARRVQNQADMMAQKGWANEASALQKWVLELRGKSLEYSGKFRR